VSRKQLSRREFLRLSGLTAAGGLLAACAPAATPAPAAAPTTSAVVAPAAAAAAPTAAAVAAATVPVTVAAPATAGGTISVLVASDKEWVPALIQKFTADTGIKVSPSIVDWNDLGTKFTVAAAGGASTYDVVDVDPSAHGAFMKAGYLEPLDRYMASVQNDIVNPSIFSYNGKIYGMPWFIDALFFFYNKDMLDKAGISAPPATWDELRTQSLTLQQKNIVKYPLAFQWKQIEGEFDLYLTMLFGNGGKFLDDTLTKPMFTSPEGVAALQYLADLNLKDKLVNPGSFAMRPLEVMTEMSQNRAAFAIIWGEVAGSLNDASKSQVVGKIGSSLIPVAKAGNASWTVDGSECLAIPAKSANKDAAWKFIQYFTNKEQSLQVTKALGALPVWKSLFTDPALATNPWTKPFLEQLKNDYSRPGQAWYSELSQTMQVQTIAALNGSKPPKQALDEAAAKAVDLLKS
jgi:multiple sugar transport system substrate-binding protein